MTTLMQVLQRYFTPHSAAMAEYALANAVINRVKGQAKHSDEAHLSPITSLNSKEGEHSSPPCTCLVCARFLMYCRAASVLLGLCHA